MPGRRCTLTEWQKDIPDLVAAERYERYTFFKQQHHTSSPHTMSYPNCSFAAVKQQRPETHPKG